MNWKKFNNESNKNMTDLKMPVTQSLNHTDRILILDIDLDFFGQRQITENIYLCNGFGRLYTYNILQFTVIIPSIQKTYTCVCLVSISYSLHCRHSLIPWTMMIHSSNTALTNSTMMSSGWSICFTSCTHKVQCQDQKTLLVNVILSIAKEINFVPIINNDNQEYLWIISLLLMSSVYILLKLLIN
ncbi:hypothetical protein AGLY_003757 [Aphis glycines]|uniref:Uncharacterized protein n=1 Tax=Aphis glycines TaxID=307491 RepID=A0A6G0TZ41_APHGL|nr:hypothetical protein AGLY_003757 [Aphis glycines]